MKTNKLLTSSLFILGSFTSYAQVSDTLDISVYPNSNPANYATSLISGADNSIWVGTGAYRNSGSTTGKGIYRFDMIQWNTFTKADGSLPSDNVISMHKDLSARIWVGTDKGLATYFNGKWTTYNRNNSALKCDSILGIDSRSNNTYIGTANGLFIFNGSTFSRYDSLQWKLGTNEIQAVCVAKDGSVYLGTAKGVIRMKNASWTTYQDSSFKPGFVEDIKEDGFGRIWLSTRTGYYILEKGLISTLASRFSCNLHSYSPKWTGQMAVDDKGSIFLKGYEEVMLTSSVMIKIDGEAVLKYYSFPKIGPHWHNFLFLNGYLWKTGNVGAGISRFNYRAYTDLYSKIHADLSDSTLVYLNINKVSAIMQTRGDMYYSPTDGPVYEDKDYPCKDMFFKSALWLSAKDEDNGLHLSAMTYRQKGWDYTPGPLDTVTAAQAGYRNFNRIWKINRSEIETFKIKFADGSIAAGTYQIPGDILRWPAHGAGKFSHNLAPFVDQNSDGKYNPYDGDYPLIKGDQMLYWIFNDNILHSETGGVPLLVEVHASAYAFYCDTINPNSPREALNRTTFYEYRIINRSKKNYPQTKFAVWADFDIGNYADDFVGSNPRLHTAFGYNGDSFDEGLQGFGNKPPIANIIFLSDSLYSFIHFTNGAPYPAQDPNNATEYYNYMSGKYQNGASLKYGGAGMGGPDCRYMFPGNDDPSFPGQDWSEKTAGNKPGDRRGLLGSYPFSLDAGATRTITYAVMHTENYTGSQGDEQRNEDRIMAIRSYYSSQQYPACANKYSVSSGKSVMPKSSLIVYPNPTHGSLSFDIHLKTNSELSITISNLLGQQVATKAVQSYSGGQHSIEMDLSNLAAGVYVYTIHTGSETLSGKLVIQK